MSATTSLTPDSDRILEMLRHELGPELLGLLTDPKITNIHANEDGSVFVRTTTGTEVDAGFRLARERRRAILTSCAALLGTVVSTEHPALAGKLAAWSARLQATVEPLTTAPQFVLRKPSRRLLTLTDYVAQGTLGAAAALYLGQAVLARRNVVIAGPADAGKTTFANALLAHLLEKHPEERLVVIEEEARELRLEAPNVVRLLATAGFSARDLVRLALRENPSRLILGEARGAECYEWLRAANTGHEGGLLTLHARSAADVLERLADMIAEAGVEPSPRRIARTVHVIVYLEPEEASGRRRVREVLEVSDAGVGEAPRLLKIH